MSSASPGAGRSRRAILFRCHRQHNRPHFDPRGGSRQRRRFDWKIEQQVDPQPRVAVAEIATGGSVEPKPNRGDPTVVDRRDDLAMFVNSRGELEPVLVEDVNERRQAIAGRGDDEIEVSRDPRDPSVTSAIPPTRTGGSPRSVSASTMRPTASR
jgi:hypothetical protein